MSVSDRDRAGAFEDFWVTSSATAVSDRAEAFWNFFAPVTPFPIDTVQTEYRRNL
jgi:hypothetical protein